LRGVIRIFLILLAISVTALPGIANASKPQIVNINVKERFERLFVSANLDGAFSKSVKEALISGMPVCFSYNINLKKSRMLFWDKNEKSLRIHKIVKYNSFTKEFNGFEVVSEKAPNPVEFEKKLSAMMDMTSKSPFSEKPTAMWDKTGQYHVFKDIFALEMWMDNVRNVYIGKTGNYSSKGKYYVQVKAELASRPAQNALNYLFYFMPFLDLDTPWESSKAFMMKGAGNLSTRLAGSVTQ